MFHVIYNVIPHNIIVYNILLQHDYIALSDTDTIGYIQHYMDSSHWILQYSIECNK